MVCVNTVLGEEIVENERSPLGSSSEQVAEDLERLRKMQVDELFFDMNRFSIPVEEQFQALERLRAVST